MSHQGGEELDAEFQEFIEKKLEKLNMPYEMVERHLNVDFSGGEKKKNEIYRCCSFPKACFP